MFPMWMVEDVVSGLFYMVTIAALSVFIGAWLWWYLVRIIIWRNDRQIVRDNARCADILAHNWPVPDVPATPVQLEAQELMEAQGPAWSPGLTFGQYQTMWLAYLDEHGKL